MWQSPLGTITPPKRNPLGHNHHRALTLVVLSSILPGRASLGDVFLQTAVPHEVTKVAQLSVLLRPVSRQSVCGVVFKHILPDIHSSRLQCSGRDMPLRMNCETKLCYVQVYKHPACGGSSLSTSMLCPI